MSSVFYKPYGNDLDSVSDKKIDLIIIYTRNYLLVTVKCSNNYFYYGHML